jgi:hypothetical protein
MKKIITLLFCTAVLTSAFAQRNNRNWNRQYNNNVYQNGNRISERNMQIQRVVAHYNYKIQQVSYDRSLSRRERKRLIKNLEAQRNWEVSRINSGYNNGNVYNDGFNKNRGNRNNDHDYDDDRYNR